MRVMGIDPSLNSTGIIILDLNKNCLRSEVIGYKIQQSSTESDKIKRNLIIAKKVVDVGKEMDVDLIGIEGLGITAKNGKIGNQIYLAELSGILKAQIFLSLKKIPHVVPPPSWKKEIIGKGNADKKFIRKVLEEKNYKFNKQDLYDALGVSMYILKRYGNRSFQ